MGPRGWRSRFVESDVKKIDFMCGYCRSSMKTAIKDNSIITCWHCGKTLRFEVEKGRIIQHPGEKSVRTENASN
jgi:RNase P subunit RPR2